MMRAALTVFRKEFLENLRDRRTVLTALLFGPLFGPLFFAAMLQFSLDRSRVGADESIQLAVLHPENAPNLIAFLEARGVQIKPADGAALGSSKSGITHASRALLEIPADFGARLASGQPAALRLYSDSSRTGNAPYTRRISALLSQYSRLISMQRMALRGIDPTLLVPIAVQDIDVSTPAGRALLVLGMLSFFIVLSLLTGGMYLAIDTTVGERERGTLEPLLAAPVARDALLLGKLLATCSYMLLSLTLTTSALCFALGRIDLEQFGMSADLGPVTAATLVLISAPLIPLLAAGMTLVAAATRSAREAQAWLGVLQLLPTLPLVFASLLNLSASLPLMAVPSLSQHLLITRVLRAEAMDPLQTAISVGSSLLIGALLLVPALRLYRSERILGH